MATANAHRLRQGRCSEHGRPCLITIVVHRRCPAFEEWTRARAVIAAMKAAEREGDIRTLCWVIMPDHLHWLIELPAGSLHTVIGRFKSRSTVAFNRAQSRTGRLWQKGFHDRALRCDEQARKAARYVIANPLRAGLVTRVGDYPLWDAVWL